MGNVLTRPAGSVTGFSLVEVILGIAIFAMALMPLMGLFGRGSVSTQVTSDYQTAMQAGASFLRTLVALPASQLPIGNPVPLDRTFGTTAGQTVRVPSREVLNNTTFDYRLQIRYVMRDAAKKDLWFEFSPEPGRIASMTAYKQFLRLDFEVAWTSRLDRQPERLKLIMYKADLE